MEAEDCNWSIGEEESEVHASPLKLKKKTVSNNIFSPG